MATAGTPNSQLYVRVREDILNGVFPPGAFLGETVLAQRYGVSRTPVREALRRLEQDCIVERSGRQLRVAVTSPEEVLEIYECRITIEGMGAEMAARRRTDLDIARLDKTLAQMTALKHGTPSEMANLNHVWHELMWRSSHNLTLVDLLLRLDVHIRRYPEPTVSQPGRWAEVLEEHRAIGDAIAVEDGARARELTVAHMTRARDIRLKMLSRFESSG